MPSVQHDRMHGVIRESYWRPYLDAVIAMQLHDLLILEIPEEKKNSWQTRLTDIQHSEFKTVTNWYGGKVFIVRVL